MRALRPGRDGRRRIYKEKGPAEEEGGKRIYPPRREALCGEAFLPPGRYAGGRKAVGLSVKGGLFSCAGYAVNGRGRGGREKMREGKRRRTVSRGEEERWIWMDKRKMRILTALSESFSGYPEGKRKEAKNNIYGEGTREQAVLRPGQSGPVETGIVHHLFQQKAFVTKSFPGSPGKRKNNARAYAQGILRARNMRPLRRS